MIAIGETNVVRRTGLTLKVIAAATVGLAVAAMSRPAEAADLVGVPPSATPLFTWTGFNVGGNIGYGWPRLGTGSAAVAAVYGSVPHPSGPEFGIQAGYGYEFANHIVAGVEGDLSVTDVRVTIGIPPVSQAKVDSGFMGSARGKIGYAFDRLLLYVTGGYSFAHIHATGFNGIIGPFSVSNTHNGYTLGLGAEYAITDHWIGRIEYSHAQYDKQVYVAALRDGWADIVRLGLDWKF